MSLDVTRLLKHFETPWNWWSVVDCLVCFLCILLDCLSTLGQSWPILASQNLSSAKATRMAHPAKLRLEMQDTLDHLCRLLLVKQDPQGNEKLIVCETSWICVGSTPFRQTPLEIPQIQLAPIRRRIQRPIPRRMAHRLAAAQNKFCGAAQC